ELRVAAGVAAVLHGEAEQFVARGVERLAPRFQDLAPLGEGQLAERGEALRPGMLEGGAEVDAGARCAGEGLFGRRIDQRRERLPAFDPPARDVAAERLHGAADSIVLSVRRAGADSGCRAAGSRWDGAGPPASPRARMRPARSPPRSSPAR